MAQCQSCGTEVAVGASACPSCGQPVEAFAQAAPEQATVPPAATYAAPAKVQKMTGFMIPPPVPGDDSSIWAKILIFLNPILAVIFYLLWRDEKPAAAKGALRLGWLATVVWTLIALGMFVLYFVIIFLVVLAGVAGSALMF